MFIELTKIYITDDKEYYKNNILSDDTDYDEVKFKIIKGKLLVNPVHIKTIDKHKCYVGWVKGGESHYAFYTHVSLGDISYDVQETPKEIRALEIIEMKKYITNKLNELCEE